MLFKKCFLLQKKVLSAVLMLKRMFEESGLIKKTVIAFYIYCKI